MPTTHRIVTALVWAAVSVSLLMTAVAFWLSYSHLHTIAHGHGVTTWARSWAWPAIVDMFIVVGEIALVLASLTNDKPWSGWALTIGGTVTSIGINVWGVGLDADILTYVVAGLPSLASLISFGVVMRYLHRYLSRVTADETPATEAVTVTRQDSTPAPAVTPAPTPPPPVTPPAATPALTHAIPKPSLPALPPPAGGMLTTAQAATYLGVGRTAVSQAVSRGTLTPDDKTPNGYHLFLPATLDAYRSPNP